MLTKFHMYCKLCFADHIQAYRWKANKKAQSDTSKNAQINKYPKAQHRIASICRWIWTQGPERKATGFGPGPAEPTRGRLPLGAADPSPAHLGTAFRRGGAEPILPQSPRANCSLHPREPTFHTYLRRGRGRLHSSHHIHNQHYTLKAFGHYLFLVFFL